MGEQDSTLEVHVNAPAEHEPSFHENLLNLNTNKDAAALEKAGGVAGLAKQLNSDLNTGLTEEEVLRSREKYGANVFPGKPPPSFLAGLWDAVQDPMIIILLVVAIVTVILGAAIPEQRAHQGWVEGVAVFVTAILVVFISAAQDYSKALQFQKLNALKDIIEIKVTRDGKQLTVENTEVVVGDVLLLDTGDKLIADGIAFESLGLVIDEASLTGESDPIKKEPGKDPWCRSGTTVNEGAGKMLVVAVGTDSEWGKTLALVSEAGDDMTPLQEQLKDLATKISKFGVLAAVVCFLALFIKWLIEEKGFNVDKINDNGPLQFLLYAITITVVSIPEGLPLAVTLTLAYSMKRMMKDNNFVRVLAACETMGGATTVCSDKTGTLTENRMTVVEGWFCGEQMSQVPTAEQLTPDVHLLLSSNCALNAKAFLVDQPTGVVDFVGNRTECALLVFIRKLGHDYEQLREERGHDNMIRFHGFSSARKMASVVLREDSAANGLRVHTKGAAEWVLASCTSMIGPDGGVVPLSDEKRKDILENTVTAMASRGLRCICLAYKDLPPNPPDEELDTPEALVHSMTVYAIVGIKDPVRKEVPHAVATCQKAGVVVRMVTGDNIHTARHISKECGLFDESQGHIALEGPVFRTMPAAELIPILPNLRVLARSSPEDKLTLVRTLKSQGEVVAVTGDGTNDAPALKESNVGLAMGIAGTEVAKEAADIIILDDNFNSIVKAILWGRCVYGNIRKFLVFQLSVNTVAMISAVVGAIAGGVPPLNVLQLLWVNMIMDTLAALALATESPVPELLEEPPHGGNEPLITGFMYLHIVTGSIYKLFWLFLCLYALPVAFDRYSVKSKYEWLQSGCHAYLTEEGYGENVPFLCNVLTYCGFPEGDQTRQTEVCGLHTMWQVNHQRGVPSNAKEALCYLPGESEKCDRFKLWEDADKDLESEYTRELTKQMKPALSVLFNAFIMAQVFNAFVSRRIHLEYDFFRDITHSPIFLSVMGIIAVLQVIIMETPINTVFKVHGLDYKEWLSCIAIGVGVFPYSWFVRWAVRQMIACGCVGSNMVDAMRGKRMATLGRSVSGRMSSANNSMKAPGSMKMGNGSVRANHNMSGSQVALESGKRSTAWQPLASAGQTAVGIPTTPRTPNGSFGKNKVVPVAV